MHVIENGHMAVRDWMTVGERVSQTVLGSPVPSVNTTEELASISAERGWPLHGVSAFESPHSI